MESIYQYVLDELEERRGEWKEIARDTGISYRTIQKIARQIVADPGVSRIETLAKYFGGLTVTRRKKARGA